MQSLRGKVALITGASEGIGAMLAGTLQRRGVKLALLARRADKLLEVGGSDAVIIAGDVTNEAVRQRCIEETISRFGRLDILINNAGRGLYQSVSHTTIDDARRLMELNFFAPMALAQLATPMLIKTGGSIVNISSIAGQLPLPWLPVYSASKAALESICACQRMELKRSGIHVMCVCPGYVRTGFHGNAEGPRPPQAVVAGKRFAITPEQCAEAIVHGIEHRKRTVVTPGIGWAILWLYRFLPQLVESRLETV